MTAKPDHLVVSAPTLDKGVAWVEEQLGISLSPRRGGEHDGKGTHNVLLGLGPELYLEIIALNPKTDTRNPPRWSWLDNLPADTAPSLEHWLVRTPDLAAALAASTIKPGEIHSMRRGTLSWLLTLTPDGSLTTDGAMPSLIQWQEDHPHPVASNLPDLGCRLLKLEVRHTSAKEISDSLQAIGLDDDRMSVGSTPGPKLVATIDTPSGVRTLSSAV